MFDSFCCAINGLILAVKEERNIKIHIAAALSVLAAGWLIRLSILEWVGISLTVFFVLVAELFNTALERVVDLAAGGEYHALAKVAKDVAAAGVLLAALNAIIVGCLIFGTRIWG